MRYEADQAADGAGRSDAAEMTDKAVRSRPEGFFPARRGGRIDHAHHAGGAKRALIETVFEWSSNAIRRGGSAAGGGQARTRSLIVVPRNHSHVFTDRGYPSRGNNIPRPGARGAGQGWRRARQLARQPGSFPYTTLGYQQRPGCAAVGRPDLTVSAPRT